MRPVPGYDGYFATEDGRVFSVRLGQGIGAPREHRQYPDHEGYPRVRFVRDGRRSWIKVAKVIALAFLPPKPSETHQVRHLDGNNKNNAASNLAWGTPVENMRDRDRHGTTRKGETHGNSKLTAVTVLAIKERLALGHKQSDVAREFGIIQAHVSRIKRGASWAHLKETA